MSMKTQCVSHVVETGISRQRRRGLDLPIYRELIFHRLRLLRLIRTPGLESAAGEKTGKS